MTIDNNTDFLDLDSILEQQLQNTPQENNNASEEEKTLDLESSDDLLVDNQETKEEFSIINEESDKEEKTESDSNVLKTYYDFLKEQELIITEDDYEFDGKEESLELIKQKTLESYRQKVLEELNNSLPENFKKVLKYGLEGGKDPSDIFNQVDILDTDITVKTNQELIVKTHLKETTNFSDEKINKMISNLDKAGELEAEAYDALDELKEIREERDLKQQQALVESRQQFEKREKELRDTVIDSIQQYDIISKERKGKIQAFMFNPIKKGTEVLTDYQRHLKAISSNPKHLVQLADILFDYNESEGINLERFKKQGETKANQTLKEKLENKMSNLKTGGNIKTTQARSTSVN